MSKKFGTAETINIILMSRQIMSDAILEMDNKKAEYITESSLHAIVTSRVKNLDPIDSKKIKIAFSTDNLLSSHILVNLDTVEGSVRLYFQRAVIEVIRLCDASLFKHLTDSKLKTQLSIFSSIYKTLTSGKLTYLENDQDYKEEIDNLFSHLSDLLGLLDQNVLKMKTISKELEEITSQKGIIKANLEEFIGEKEEWLNKVIQLYDRHITPTLMFLNPDSSYENSQGLYKILKEIVKTLRGHGKEDAASLIERYLLSLLNLYQPIENVANSVNRFIHRQRDSIVRFNAFEHYYNKVLLKDFQETLSDNLTRKRLSDEGIVFKNFIEQIKVNKKPKDYLFNESSAYFFNLFNELEARTNDLFILNDLKDVKSTASYNPSGERRVARYEELVTYLNEITLLETNDLHGLIHNRLEAMFYEYQLYDLISALRFYKSNDSNFNLMTTNNFGTLTYKGLEYEYRKVVCESVYVE